MKKRNASAVFADLHEAIRKRRVSHITSDGNMHRRLPETISRLNLDRAVYDFDAWVAQAARDGSIPVAEYKDGMQLAADKQLIADQCALMWTYIAHDGAGPISHWDTERVMFLDRTGNDDDGVLGWIVHIFERENATADGSPTTFGGNRWTLQRIVMSPTGWSEEISPEKFDASPGDGDREHWQMMMALTFACCGALAQEPELVESHSTEFLSMNAGRAYGKLNPIKPVRFVVKVHRKTYVRSGPSEPTGREMPFHYRRGTFRTYRHERYVNVRGQRAPVSSALVRADKADGPPPTPPIYKVE